LNNQAISSLFGSGDELFGFAAKDLDA